MHYATQKVDSLLEWELIIRSGEETNGKGRKKKKQRKANLYQESFRLFALCHA
jgi:hypothetical protein